MLRYKTACPASERKFCMHLIEVCAGNAHHGTEAVLKKLEQQPDIEVIAYGCLGNCGECFLTPYALVNGQFVAAETPDTLYDAIMQAIAAQEEQQAALDKLIDDL